MPYNVNPISSSHDPSFKRKKSPADLVMDPKHFRQLLRRIRTSPDNLTNSRRDYMTSLMMGNLGLRLGEVPLLRRTHFKHLKRSPALAVVPALKKKGKDPTKNIYIHPLVSNKIIEYLETDMAENQVFLFPGAAGHGHMCKRQISRIFSSYVRACGFHEGYTPHSIRHMFGAQVYRKTKDLVFHADQLGHETVPGVSAVSRRYMHFSDSEIKAYLKRIGYFL